MDAMHGKNGGNSESDREPHQAELSMDSESEPTFEPSSCP